MAGYKTPPGTIVNTIKSLLRERYKQGFPIIKEIIQNANDGSATTLDFGIVRGLTDLVEHPLLKTPALFFLNNGTFSKLDQEAISCFGIDANAKDRGKIGKFGLGQKSIFHFCEAFFYIARSESIPEGCSEFINPWATPEGLDAKRPGWSELSYQDRQNLENFLIEQKLIRSECLHYFLLWVPLRQRMADERCILANYYDDTRVVRESFPTDMEIRIGQLLPLLRYLKDIKFWIENESGSLQQQFNICLDDKYDLERFLYPTESEEIVPDDHDLQGKVRLSTNTSIINFAGKESILPANDFASLLNQRPERVSHNFWKDLEQSPFWTKRSSINENAEEESKPDKSIPHCAVVFTKQSLINRCKARLILQWSVFLPLASDENTSSPQEAEQEAYEQVDCDGDNDFTIFLHGYFFLDSGRKYIEGLQNIRNGGVVPNTPSNENEMIAQWNYLLATKGTLKLFLPSLHHFTKTHNLSHQEISNLCKAICKSYFFQSSTYKQSICSFEQWVFRIKSSGSAWELIPANAIVRSLPGIPPNWQAFPKLHELSEQSYLILDKQPNLLSDEISYKWQEHEICAVLASITIHLFYADVDNLNYLVGFLNQPKNIVNQSQVQTLLKNLVREGFLKMELQTLRQEPMLSSLKKLIALIRPEQRLVLAKNQAKEQAIQQVFRKLYILERNEDLLLIYSFFDSPLSSSCGILSSQQTISILNCLSELLRTDLSSQTVSQSFVEEILEQISDPVPIFNNLQNTPLFFGFNLCQRKSYIYTYLQLQKLHQKNLLFKGTWQTAIANALQEAFPNCELIFINEKLARVLEKLPCMNGIPKCEFKSCLQLLSTKPKLAISENRVNLLRELINHV
ncbi:hypothetical protein WA1_13155 [Scytonema hofmannii PCC 7110]|uniref:Sacsin/Nov domain-containing protein n=1 Tax=Scytonema hofmannii PCC 7110 TaxID=128403 RepID=A0A139XEB6_9CYAN|nr:hypothetical protein [Scytonema hofmannii]KYC43044.1 hypothetical protein WA1_13155 [Scytonema hofmannii PCC 7110]